MLPVDLRLAGLGFSGIEPGVEMLGASLQTQGFQRNPLTFRVVLLGGPAASC